MAKKNESAEALARVQVALRAIRTASAAHRKAGTDATESAVHVAYEDLVRAAKNAADAMPVLSPVLRRALQGRSVRPTDRYVDVACLERANRDGGYHFFDADTLRYFGSRLPSHGYQGSGEVYFVTSERRPRSNDARGWTVRVMHANGSTDDIGGFQAYGSSKAADRAAQRLADESRAAGHPIGEARAAAKTLTVIK